MFTAVVDLPTPPFWLATARTRRSPFKVSRWIRKVTLALLAAASRSMVGSSLSSSIGVPGVNGDVSRETSTPASAAARDTASRTAIAASSSTASSSSPGSIPSSPPADVSRETSTLRGLVGVSRKSTSPASACRVTVDVFEPPGSTSATRTSNDRALLMAGLRVDSPPIRGSPVVTSTNSVEAPGRRVVFGPQGGLLGSRAMDAGQEPRRSAPRRSMHWPSRLVGGGRPDRSRRPWPLSSRRGAASSGRASVRARLPGPLRCLAPHAPRVRWGHAWRQRHRQGRLIPPGPGRTRLTQLYLVRPLRPSGPAGVVPRG